MNTLSADIAGDGELVHAIQQQLLRDDGYLIGISNEDPKDLVRTAAATQTANTNPACSLTALPEGFYWEIGDRNGLRASGSVMGNRTPTPTEVIAIASASKWLYGAYVAERRGGAITGQHRALDRRCTAPAWQ